jgi:hypothetical protein
MRGYKPEWAHLRKRICKNCGEPFKPKQPSQWFCKPKCRWFYAQHGKVARLLLELQKRVETVERRFNGEAD